MTIGVALAEDDALLREAVTRLTPALLVAVADCHVASAPAESIDRESLQGLSTGHRREASNVG